MADLPSAATNGRVSLRTFLRTRLMLGFYWPLGARALRCLAWLYCLCLSHTLITIFITAVNESGFPLAIFLNMIIEYSGNVIISLLTGENHLINYLKGIESIDREMCSNLPLITPATEFIYLITIAENCVIWSGSVIMGTQLSKIAIVMVTLVTATNLNTLMVTLPLDLLRHRLRLLRQGLEVNLNHSSLNNANDRIAMLQSSLKLYKKLLDNFYSTFNWTKLRIIIALSCSFYALLVHGHRLIQNMITESYDNPDGETVTLVLHALDYLFNSLMPCLPAVFSELASREYERLKITVGNMLLICEEKELRAELELAAEYLELRPFKVTILRMMTLDGSFVLAYISLCTTSLIFMIQTTGLF